MDVSRLLIVSNRVAIPDRTGALAAGGLAVALGEAFRMYEGVWFGWSGKIAAEPASLPHVIDKGQVQYALMDLTTSDRREVQQPLCQPGALADHALSGRSFRFLTQRL